MALPVVAVFVTLVVMSPAALSRSFGIKAGISYAEFTFDYHLTGPSKVGTAANASRRQGIDIGLFIEYNPLPLIAISPELHFVQRGSQQRIPLFDEQGSPLLGIPAVIDYRLTYISVPVLLRVHTSLGGSGLVLSAGPSLNILADVAPDAERYIESFFQSEFKSTVLGAEAGVGVEFGVPGSLSFLVELHFQWDINPALTSESVDIKNRSISLVGGLKF